jgi:hypothetical protein
MIIPQKLKPRLRLFSIYSELGYIPWKKPARPRKERKKKQKKEEGVYMGAREAIIPFLNEDSKRTFSHLLLRPGFMMRDYILRGAHEHYLAPLTALLVFYSVFTLLLAIVKPGSEATFGDELLRGFREVTVQTDSVENKKAALALNTILKTATDALILTRLDKYPEEADTPWKQSLAAFEGDLRSKGIPLFLDNFFFLWFAMAILLRKRGISLSGAAAASAYTLCQYCIFMFLALLLTWGSSTELSPLLMCILLFIDYQQLLGLGNKKAFWLTVKTGLLIAVLEVAFYLLVGLALVGVAFIRLY